MKGHRSIQAVGVPQSSCQQPNMESSLRLSRAAPCTYPMRPPSQPSRQAEPPPFRNPRFKPITTGGHQTRLLITCRELNDEKVSLARCAFVRGGLSGDL